ncbi:MAG: DNA mismatch repair protein MutS, partial [Bacteroidales bacterium]|nr:DNA mismatch repair protein MutS [Bacteroidales bacterium]
MVKSADTPLMKQYNLFKSKHPDAILLFRVGDFYETFGEDAVKTSQVLGIVLTKRANGSGTYIDLAGFPHHSIDTYLPKLVRAGLRVAICEQLEDPKKAKTIVKRGVTELITPGISLNDKVLEQRENNFLASIHFDGRLYGISFVDISTGEFYVSEGKEDYIDKLLQNFKPSEIVVQKNKVPEYKTTFGDKLLFATFDDWVFTTDFTYELLTKHFETTSLKGFGVQDLSLGIIAAGAALHYLYETQHHKIQHINKINRIEEGIYVWLDRFTIRNLELIDSVNEQAVTLLNILDQTKTPMGSRLLKKWIVMPLKEKIMIEERLAIVKLLTEERDLAQKIEATIKNIGDLERLAGKIATSKINPREVMQLSKTMQAVKELKMICASSGSSPLEKIADQLNPCITVYTKIEKELQEEPSVAVNKGGIFKMGVDEELDQLLMLSSNSKQILQDIQKREAAKTGITSLKIGYNNIFGYYLEVTNTHKNKVPPEWIRKQTTTLGERYITEELKELETKILCATDRIISLEEEMFNNLVLNLLDYIPMIQLNARLVAHTD